MPMKKWEGLNDASQLQFVHATYISDFGQEKNKKWVKCWDEKESFGMETTLNMLNDEELSSVAVLGVVHFLASFPQLSSVYMR